MLDDQQNQMTILSLSDFYLKYKSSGFTIGPEFNLEVEKGEFLGLVGESGCGKSTLGKVLIGLINDREKNSLGLEEVRGRLELKMPGFEAIDHLNTRFSNLQKFRKKVQMIFQNPRSALNLKMPVFQTLMESARTGNPGLNKMQLSDIIYKRSREVDYLPRDIPRQDFTHHKKMQILNGHLSGGERRRISIAKVMCMNPDIVIADEPLSSLDASIKLNVLNYLINEWKARLTTDNPLTMILISHDIGVVSRICTRVVIMYGDLIVERGEVIEEFRRPAKFDYEAGGEFHPYTKELIAAAKYFQDDIYSEQIEPEDCQKEIVTDGCVYYNNCPDSSDECREKGLPTEKPTASGHFSSCLKQ